MVFSATSASAALGAGDPMTFLVKQGAYALVGLVAARARLALRLPPAPRARSDAPARRARALHRGARRRAADQRRAPLVPARPDQRAAVGAREDRRLRVGVRAARPPADAANDGRAAEAARDRRRASSASSSCSSPTSARRSPSASWSAASSSSRTSRSGCSLLAGSLSLVLGAAAIYMEPYRRARFFSFLDPWQDPQGAGFQTVQAIIGMGSGGITGEGLGQGISKIFYLPEAHTDMIFAIVGEELGPDRLDARDRRVRGLRVGGLPDRAALPRSVRKAARGGDHDARLRPGRSQPLRRARHRSADRDPAAVRLLRRLVADRAARLRRRSP